MIRIPPWLHLTPPVKVRLSRLAQESLARLQVEVADAGLRMTDEQAVDLAVRSATAERLLLEAQEDMHDRSRAARRHR